MRFAPLFSILALGFSVSALAVADDTKADGTWHLPKDFFALPPRFSLPGLGFGGGSSRDANPSLGGICFRSEGCDYSGRQYSTPFVETIYASTLFKLMGDPTLEAYAKQKKLDPKADDTRKFFVAEMSDQLNQLFVLKSIANILDTEAQLKATKKAPNPFEVPFERTEFTVRKILNLDNQQMNDVIFEDFVQRLVTTAIAVGPDAVAKLADVGIPQQIVDIIQQKVPEGQDPRVIFEKFKTRFDADLKKLVQSPTHSVPGLKVPAYKDLPSSMLARLDDILNPSRNQMDQFARLKNKIGKDAFFFGVAWTEGKDDAALADIAAKFTEAWQPVVIAGQNPAYGAADTFPEDLDAFYKYVTSKLAPRQKTIARQRMANQWLFGFWRNRDILNPHPPRNGKHASDMFNPLSSLMLMIPSAEINEAYESLKFELAAKETNDFTLVEVKLGDSTEVAKTDATDVCAVVFNKAFEKPYTELQKNVLKALADPKLTTHLFDELITKARNEIPAASFEIAKAAVKAEPACANFAMELKPISLHVDEQAKNLSDDDNARVRFVGMLLQNEALQRMMIPKRSRLDNKGNVYHYFFQARHVD
ncbi:MAG: hypothetical protein HY074_19515 [Deltaproteobacteria bacterium]|nr:hypothetical protein [Deltaproteobacteria bacterium]